MTLVVDLPVPHRMLSPNSRVHWAERHRHTKSARKNAWYWFQRVKPSTWNPTPIILSVIYRCGSSLTGYSPRDVQNAIAALKPTIDGMVDAGIVPDDSAEWVSWGRFQIVKCAVGETPGVRITVETA